MIDDKVNICYDLKEWVGLGREYWMAQARIVLPSGEKAYTSVCVDPRDWVAPLRRGSPLVVDGMILYVRNRGVGL